MSEQRNKLRSHLGTKLRPVLTPIPVDLGDGVTAEVRPPTGAQRDRIFAAGDVDGAAPGKAKDHAFNVEAVIQCLCVTGTGERVYGDEDRDALMAEPAGTKWISDVGVAVLRLIGAARDAGKASATTPSGSSFSA